MRDEGFFYVAGRPLLNRRYTRLPRYIASEMPCIVSGGGIVKLLTLASAVHAHIIAEFRLPDFSDEKPPTRREK